MALLKHHLSVENHLDLLASAAGKTVGQTRELIAARFPRPDVASSVRKLPERRTMTQPSLAMSGATELAASPVPADVTSTGSMSFAAPINATCATGSKGGPRPNPPQRVALPRVSSRIEPLSAQRYKVQLTASAELARKLELARDLMRHSHPDGELGPIVERALDLLIESLMQRRFGKNKKAGPKRTSECARHVDAEPATTTTLDSMGIQVDRHGELERLPASSSITCSTRRAVVERDGLGCSWLDEHGIRCGSRAWLEYDHRHPRAKGGGSDPDNVRLLCRQHNRFAAEREYGRRHVERTIAECRRERTHTPPTI